MPYSLFIDGQEILAEPAPLRPSEHGRPGSILDTALRHGVRLNHRCGGVATCTTCHVYVKKGLATCSLPSAQENKMLAEVYGKTDESRLACQCVPSGSSLVEVEIP